MFTERAARGPVLEPNAVPEQYRLDAISVCIAAEQALLETFCTFSAQGLACAPVATFVRCGYAFIVLMKVASTSALPNSVLGKLIGRDELRMDEYFNRALGAILQAAKSDRSCMPARLALMLRNCHVKHVAEMGGEHLHKEMAPCLLPLPPSPPPPSPPALPSPPELPSTPEAQQQRGSVAQSQTPLQLLAE